MNKKWNKYDIFYFINYLIMLCFVAFKYDSIIPALFVILASLNGITWGSVTENGNRINN